MVELGGGMGPGRKLETPGREVVAAPFGGGPVPAPQVASAPLDSEDIPLLLLHI